MLEGRVALFWFSGETFGLFCSLNLCYKVIPTNTCIYFNNYELLSISMKVAKACSYIPGE